MIRICSRTEPYWGRWRRARHWIPNARYVVLARRPPSDGIAAENDWQVICQNIYNILSDSTKVIYKIVLSLNIVALMMLINIFWSSLCIPDSVTISDSVGLFTVNSHLSLRLSRADLASSLECRVETPALEQPIVNELYLDLQGNKWFMNGLKYPLQMVFQVGGRFQTYFLPVLRFSLFYSVRPTKLNLTGVKHHTVQGTKVLLQCLVSASCREISIFSPMGGTKLTKLSVLLQVNGARPAANVTWYNNTRQLIPEHELSTISTQTVIFYYCINLCIHRGFNRFV